jgi:tetratricopeptide (TPR) repeat protein
MMGLASAYTAESRTDEAINLCEEAVEAYRRLGDEVQAMGAQLNLAGALDTAGRTEDAILLYERALTDCVRLLGEDHPDTLTTINNLAAAYKSAGAIDKSVSMLERVSVASIEVLGADHPNTLGAMYNLADGYFKVGRFREALVLLAENVEKCKEVFSEPNLITAASAALLLEVVAAIDTTEDTDRNNDKI